ncbi:MAG: hypothetical protein HYT30_02040 [Parcubacteria group bacterium]|nr:hypothetical protein [Parcubacteria group bacterium]
MFDRLMKNKIVLVAFGGLFIGLVAWYTLMKQEEPAGLLETKPVEATTASPEERAILDTLFQLRAIQLTGSIFSNPAFSALRDFRTEIVAEPIGRRNPFAPLGYDSAAPEESTDTGN